MTLSYKAVLFDWDGTLVDTTALIIEAHNHVRAAFDLPPVQNRDKAGVIFKSAREAFPETYGDQAVEAERMFYEYYHAHHKDYLKFFDGAERLFQDLEKAGALIGIVSNKRHDVLGGEIEISPLKPYIKGYVGAGKAHADKPAPDPLLLAADMLDENILTAEILYVGDTETDLLCAKHCCVDCAYIHHYDIRQDLVERYQPVFTAKKLDEINAWLFERTEKKAC